MTLNRDANHDGQLCSGSAKLINVLVQVDWFECGYRVYDIEVNKVWF